MLKGWVIVLVALAYIGLLFLVASIGDRLKVREKSSFGLRGWIYPLSLAVYCTSWTFYGSVGMASRAGYEFIAIYIGPILLFTVFYPVVLRVVRVSKAQNISSAADFLGARFGKNPVVAAIVCLISLVAMIPYIALQLKAVSSSLLAALAPLNITIAIEGNYFFNDISLFVAFSMAVFTALFGTRHADATEHQQGMMLAIATESVIKLIAFLCVGFYVCYVLFNGTNDIFAQIRARPINPLVDFDLWKGGNFVTITILSLVACLLLPRMFHVAVVENRNEEELKRTRWLFPLYIFLINLFVLPLALAGLLYLPPNSFDSDMMMIAIPLQAGAEVVLLIAFIGGLSAATAMVIVACIALSIMISNDLILPAIFGWKPSLVTTARRDMTKTVLIIRRSVIFIVMLLAFIYYRVAGSHHLASIGLLSFAAIAQLAPAFFGGLFWRGANARGAIWGMVCGILIWAYTLMMPNLADAGVISTDWLGYKLFGLDFLKPQEVLGIHLTPLANGSFWSLFINITAFIVMSKTRAAKPTETIQAELFVPQSSRLSPTFRLRRTSVSVFDLENTVARYIGEKRTASSFSSFAALNAIQLAPQKPADVTLLRYAEHLLTSAIGTASARLVISTLLKSSNNTDTNALRLLDDAHAVMQYNKDVLQIALEHSRQGICVFDREHNLVLWNSAFSEILDLPIEMARVGVGYDEILTHLAERGEFGEGKTEALVSMRLERFLEADEPYKALQIARGLVIEIGTSKLPDGGLVATYTDVTESFNAANELAKVNTSLEKRVNERTEELTKLNADLHIAREQAEEANLSKTKFLAAASHDILQPLNAARLYTTALVEQSHSNKALIQNIDASLESVEEIIGALLDISRLDAGAIKPEFSLFPIDDLFRQLAVEFAPIAAQKGLQLKFVTSRYMVKSDRRFLRRILQNLVSNALKYTPKGRVLVGCRFKGKNLVIMVADEGIGIPLIKQKIIFKEFQRLEQGAKVARGLGLGLSIVERIARMLDHPLHLVSKMNKGSRFSIEVPFEKVKSETQTVIEAPPLPLSSLSGMRLLAIDNEPRILEGMALLLGGWGCDVTVASSVAEAHHKMQSKPQGLLVDYHLDHGNGLDAIQNLREDYGYIPATLITADRSDAMREMAAELNITVLNKPLKPAALRALLGQWNTIHPTR